MLAVIDSILAAVSVSAVLPSVRCAAFITAFSADLSASKKDEYAAAV
jgi:hypothetical protein